MNPSRSSPIIGTAPYGITPEKIFGTTITLSTGRVIPTRLVGEQHAREDLSRIPSFADQVRAIRPEPWMGRATTLHLEDAPPVTRAGSHLRGLP